MKTPAETFLKHLLESAPEKTTPAPHNADLGKRYTKLAQHFAKVMAISDKYQAETIDMADRLRRSKEELETAQETLRRSEERFRALSENLPVGVAMIGPDMEVLAANPKMSECFPEGELGSSNFWECLTESDEDHPLHQTWEDGETRSVEQEVVVHGDRRHLRITAAAVKSDNGAIEALIEMVEDITEQKEIEQRKKEIEAREQSYQKTESLHRMAGAIAHHFNNQLHAVMGNLELALSGSSADGIYRKNLDQALCSAKDAAEMSVLMRRYLGEAIFSPNPVCLAEICHQQLPALRNALPPTCSLQANLPEPGPTIQGNADHIGQILTSLVTNAWEACESVNEGRIDVTLETVDSTAIPLSQCFPVGWQPTEATCACLTVSDNGQGIESKDIDNIFDPFFSRKVTGRGLGLAVVAGLTRGHDGAVSAESAAGKGSTFRCYFPIRPSPSPSR